jgi:hypothetical protein
MLSYVNGRLGNASTQLAEALVIASEARCAVSAVSRFLQGPYRASRGMSGLTGAHARWRRADGKARYGLAVMRGKRPQQEDCSAAQVGELADTHRMWSRAPAATPTFAPPAAYWCALAETGATGGAGAGPLRRHQSARASCCFPCPRSGAHVQARRPASSRLGCLACLTATAAPTQQSTCRQTCSEMC